MVHTLVAAAPKFTFSRMLRCTVGAVRWLLWVKNRPAACALVCLLSPGADIPRERTEGSETRKSAGWVGLDMSDYPHSPRVARVWQGYTSHICALPRQGLHWIPVWWNSVRQPRRSDSDSKWPVNNVAHVRSRRQSRAEDSGRHHYDIFV